jgi:hypothetical protein
LARTAATHITTIAYNVIPKHREKQLLEAYYINPLNAELYPICHLLALGAHHILHVGRIRVNAVAVDKG